MYYPNKEQFIKLAKKGNLIPVYKQVSADLATPVSAFLKIKDANEAFLLESVEGQEKIARYSFLGFRPSLVFKSKGRHVQIIDKNKKRKKNIFTQTNPLDEVKKFMQRFKFVSIKGLPRFCGGLVGYIGYDMVRFFERLPDKNPDDLKLPDCILILADTLLIFDHINKNIKIVSNVFIDHKSKADTLYKKACEKIDSLYDKLKFRIDYEDSPKSRYKRKIQFQSNFKKRQFQKIVEKSKYYIKSGEIIQVVLSQRFKAKVSHITPFSIYINLRKLNPSAYMFFLDLKELKLIGSSPEMLVRCEEGLIQTRPIAGTRPRGKTKTEDKLLEKELINDQKERAEHLMLVDLGRNDLGRVSGFGKVRVFEFMNVERYSHVMHLVSEIRGTLDKSKDIYHVLKAAFPAGTVCGSPKVRAMQIIDELENIRRGPYAGCIGYFSFSGNLDTCITIRTIIIKRDFAYIQAGAGIVADSVPEREYFESVNKAKALMEAIGGKICQYV